MTTLTTLQYQALTSNDIFITLSSSTTYPFFPPLSPPTFLLSYTSPWHSRQERRWTSSSWTCRTSTARGNRGFKNVSHVVAAPSDASSHCMYFFHCETTVCKSPYLPQQRLHTNNNNDCTPTTTTTAHQQQQRLHTNNNNDCTPTTTTTAHQQQQRLHTNNNNDCTPTDKDAIQAFIRKELSRNKPSKKKDDSFDDVSKEAERLLSIICDGYFKLSSFLTWFECLLESISDNSLI